MTASPLDIRVQDIDHCGIVVGICDEMNLVEQFNRLLGTDAQEIISAGQVVKAMILNGLGFVSAPLYLFESQARKDADLKQLEKRLTAVAHGGNPKTQKGCGSRTRGETARADWLPKTALPYRIASLIPHSISSKTTSPCGKHD